MYVYLFKIIAPYIIIDLIIKRIANVMFPYNNALCTVLLN